MMSRGKLLWLVPIFITIHNLEEALFMPAFLQRRNDSMPQSLRDLLPPITYGQFLIALFIVTAVPYLIRWFGSERGVAIHLLLGLQVVMLLNVLAHVMMAAVMGGYAPGLVTALTINLPFSVYVLRRALKEDWVSRKAVALMFPVGLFIHGVGLPGLMILLGNA
jgi:Protein of unknown function with HXXEE motif